MNGRERFLAVMSYGSVDRLPNYELACWDQTTSRWRGEGMPADLFDTNWFEGEPYFEIERRAFAPINVEPLPEYECQILEEDERYITIRNAKGIVTKALKEGTVGHTRMSMDLYLDFPVKDKQTWQDVKKRYAPNWRARYPRWWDEQARLWKDRDYPCVLLNNGTFGLYGQLRFWVGTENLCYMFYDDPALIKEMLEFMTDFFLQLVDKALDDVEFDMFNFFEDMAGKSGPLISPLLFEKFFRPCYEKIITKLRSKGVKYIWMDCDGNIEPLIPQLMDVGIDCLWPLEQASGMDPVRLRKKFGRDLLLSGGIDKRELSKDKKAIEKELYAKIPPMLDSGGYIPTLDHAFPPDISYDNFLCYMELKKKLIGF